MSYPSLILQILFCKRQRNWENSERWSLTFQICSLYKFWFQRVAFLWIRTHLIYWVSQVVQGWRICLLIRETQETQVRFLGWENPLEEGMATYSRIHAWRIPMDREACWAAVSGVTELDTTEWLSTHTEVLYDPAIPLLHIYPEKMKTLIRNDTGTPM